MADIADDADGLIEQSVLAGVARAARAGMVIKPMGYCLFCGSDTMADGTPFPQPDEGRPMQLLPRWCDDGCRKDWSRVTGVR
jgi:hypothetical protein